MLINIYKQYYKNFLLNPNFKHFKYRYEKEYINHYDLELNILDLYLINNLDPLLENTFINIKNKGYLVCLDYCNHVLNIEKINHNENKNIQYNICFSIDSNYNFKKNYKYFLKKFIKIKFYYDFRNNLICEKYIYTKNIHYDIVYNENMKMKKKFIKYANIYSGSNCFNTFKEIFYYYLKNKIYYKINNVLDKYFEFSKYFVKNKLINNLKIYFII